MDRLWTYGPAVLAPDEPAGGSGNRQAKEGGATRWTREITTDMECDLAVW